MGACALPIEHAMAKDLLISCSPDPNTTPTRNVFVIIHTSPYGLSTRTVSPLITRSHAGANIRSARRHHRSRAERVCGEGGRMERFWEEDVCRALYPMQGDPFLFRTATFRIFRERPQGHPTYIDGPGPVAFKTPPHNPRLSGAVQDARSPR